MNDEAFTGLEAAIVLIAFVVVAAVFSYVMLGAGFFTSQKSQEVVQTSVDQASSSVEAVGSVVGYGVNITDDSGKRIGRKISDVKFTIATTAGGSAFDLRRVAVVYTDRNNHKVISPLTGLIDDFGVKTFGFADTGCVKPDDAANKSGYWAVTEYLKSQDGDMGKDNSVPPIPYAGDVLVEPGEQVVITVHLPQGTNLKDSDADAILLKQSERFSIELKPAAGASLLIKRSAPPQIDDVNFLY